MRIYNIITFRPESQLRDEYGKRINTGQQESLFYQLIPLNRYNPIPFHTFHSAK